MPVARNLDGYVGYTICEDCNGRIPPDCECNCGTKRLRIRVDELEAELTAVRLQLSDYLRKIGWTS